MDHNDTLENQTVVSTLLAAVAEEPYGRTLGLRVTDAAPGYSRVEMTVTKAHTNIFGMGHGGAVFSLIDEAFQVACNTHGLSAFALNVSVTYVRPAWPGDHLVAEAREVVLTARTGTYEVNVVDSKGRTVAVAQALSFRKEDPLPFLVGENR